MDKQDEILKELRALREEVKGLRAELDERFLSADEAEALEEFLVAKRDGRLLTTEELRKELKQ